MSRSGVAGRRNSSRHRARDPVRFTRRGRYVFGGALAVTLGLVAFLPGRGAIYATGSFGSTVVAEAPDATSSLRLVGFGDSVPSGYGCDCQPFLPIYADMIHRQSKRSTVWSNFAVSGQVSSGVL